jgi:hypothetical protein
MHHADHTPLRRTAARWMRMHGVSADEVAQQLGHRKLGATDLYTEYDPRHSCSSLSRARFPTKSGSGPQRGCQILARRACKLP